MSATDPDILIFEPGVVGHRLTWLRYITEDFLDLGYRVAWAVDLRPGTRGILEQELSPLFSKVTLLSVGDDQHRWRGGTKVKALAACLGISGARQVFVNEFDEIASNMLRWAAMGVLPPLPLKGRLSGVYFRPRFLTDPCRPPTNLVKAAGFRRLRGQGWFQHLYLMDEYLFASLSDHRKKGLFHLLPDPWDGDFSLRTEPARAALEIPKDKVVFLHYGMGDRRKGLHLVVEAMEAPASDSRMFLLCAGQIGHDRRLTGRLQALVESGAAKLVNRYVSAEEERLCFCAADVVLMPYIRHYGSSGVLSRAAAAGKMIIASDEGLLARRIRDHKLGLLFQSRKVRDLQGRMRAAASLTRADFDQYRERLLRYAMTCSREAFRKALQSAWQPSGLHGEPESGTRRISR